MQFKNRVLAEYDQNDLANAREFLKNLATVVDKEPNAYIDIEVTEDDDTWGTHQREIKLVVWKNPLEY